MLTWSWRVLEREAFGGTLRVVRQGSECTAFEAFAAASNVLFPDAEGS